jgi:hypothetical protein
MIERKKKNGSDSRVTEESFPEQSDDIACSEPYRDVAWLFAREVMVKSLAVN